MHVSCGLTHLPLIVSPQSDDLVLAVTRDGIHDPLFACEVLLHHDVVVASLQLGAVDRDAHVGISQYRIHPLCVRLAPRKSHEHARLPAAWLHHHRISRAEWAAQEGSGVFPGGGCTLQRRRQAGRTQHLIHQELVAARRVESIRPLSYEHVLQPLGVS